MILKYYDFNFFRLVIYLEFETGVHYIYLHTSPFSTSTGHSERTYIIPEITEIYLSEILAMELNICYNKNNPEMI